MINILFFAQIRELLKCSQLELCCESSDQNPVTVDELKTQLAKRGDLWQLVFVEQTPLCAVNQVLCAGDHRLKSGDEVAFFPAVTGG